MIHLKCHYSSLTKKPQVALSLPITSAIFALDYIYMHIALLDNIICIPINNINVNYLK